MLTAIGAWIAAVALWTIWVLAASLMTTIAGAIFYWLLTDNDDPESVTILDHSPGNWDVPVSWRGETSSSGSLRPVAVHESCTNNFEDSEMAEFGHDFRTVDEPRHHDPRHDADIATGGLPA